MQHGFKGRTARELAAWRLKHCLITRQSAFFLILLFSVDAWANNPPEQITFGGEHGYPPFEWLEQGVPTGFNIDLARAIAEVSSSELTHTLGDWPDMLEALENGEIDVVPMFPSAARSERFLFTSPFYYTSHAIYALDSAWPVYSVDDLGGKRVAVEDRSYAQQQFSNGQIDAVLIRTPSMVSAINAVIEGNADYAVLATPVADILLREQELPLRKLGPPVWPAGYAFAVSKDRPELMEWLQHALDLTIASGRYQDIYNRWKADLDNSDADNSLGWAAIYAIAGLLLITTLIFAWSWSLRRTVKARTEELSGALERARAAESHALHLANHDTDTGLAKPHYFTQRVDDMLAAANHGPGASREMLVLKVGQLNEIVNILGKRYSDDLIQDFANRLKALSDGPCGYLGRGVFAVCSDRGNVRNLFESVVARWGTEAQNAYSHIIGGSAFYPEHGTTAANLIQHAETALAVSRSTRRRWLAYDALMEPDLLDLDIVSTFRGSQLEGLYPVFQPQISLDTRQVVGAEALVRWNHVSLGNVPPARFIPLIEKAGLVSQVTAKMIDEAVRLSASLRRAALPSTISVNITVSDLTETDLRAVVEEALKQHHGRPEDLKLELTETSVVNDSKYVKGMLHRLDNLGVSISVDDFGTGYSTMSYLSIFPIREVKIDRVFVSDMVKNSRNRSIVRSTILMASELDLYTVAEGAEDLETIEMLAHYGCDRAQGYAISKPLTEADFLDFINNRTSSTHSSIQIEPS